MVHFPYQLAGRIPEPSTVCVHFFEDLRGTAQAFPSESKDRFGRNMGSVVDPGRVVPRFVKALGVVTPTFRWCF